MFFEFRRSLFVKPVFNKILICFPFLFVELRRTPNTLFGKNVFVSWGRGQIWRNLSKFDHRLMKFDLNLMTICQIWWKFVKILQQILKSYFWAKKGACGVLWQSPTLSFKIFIFCWPVITKLDYIHFYYMCSWCWPVITKFNNHPFGILLVNLVITGWGYKETPSKILNSKIPYFCVL